MSSIHRSVIVPYTPAEMFALVDDIGAYPEFISACDRADELERSEHEVIATLTLSKSGVQKSFTTRNTLVRNSLIEMRLVEGPFRSLLGSWQFEPLGDTGCKVIFDIEFELASSILDQLFGHLFGKVIDTLVNAFSKRAINIYGQRDV